MSDEGTSRLRAWGGGIVALGAVALALAGLGLAAMSVAERRAEMSAVGAPLSSVRFYTPSEDGSWVHLSNTSRIDGAFVLLVHGLDEPGDIWDDLAPALDDAGHVVARFEYPNDQAIARSADRLMAALRAFGDAGVDRIDIVGHSMGGLVARDALTRPGVERATWVPVGTLVMVGTPHLGSALAPFRGVAELRDRAQRYAQGEATLEESLDFASDGDGGAGRDLAPGSAYLDDLNARPRPEGVRLVCVVGRWAPQWADSAASAALGDGVVSVDSATLESVDEIIEVRGNHRGMLLSTPLAGETTAVPAVIEALDAPE